ncbi:hypothetical protein SVIO_110770 [Streptomyces violaceusniger]|uniref:Uncharacterized protein n=1 Tax=Streptomyces violaceusniger TaxID=68280 RepID=A0A4D4LJ12_STRVO|nr:hypothetical protein SVIO_110770 [Streptomyces violaceusniger]
MGQRVVDIRRLHLEDNRELLSPPLLVELYQCAIGVTVFGFLPHAEIDIEVDGAVVVTQQVGFPEPVGATLPLPAPLVAGQTVRSRQRLGGLQSDWSQPSTVLDHTREFPAGPPRPQINPAPPLECGVRTGVANLLGAETSGSPRTGPRSAASMAALRPCRA